jgi:hypothetical protein
VRVVALQIFLERGINMTVSYDDFLKFVRKQMGPVPDSFEKSYDNNSIVIQGTNGAVHPKNLPEGIQTLPLKGLECLLENGLIIGRPLPQGEYRGSDITNPNQVAINAQIFDPRGKAIVKDGEKIPLIATIRSIYAGTPDKHQLIVEYFEPALQYFN